MILILANRVYCTNKSYVYYRVNNQTSLQGNFNSNNINNHILSSSAIKDELINRNIFTDRIKKDYFENVEGIIELLLNGNLSFEEFEYEYNYIKSIIVPNLYEAKKK